MRISFSKGEASLAILVRGQHELFPMKAAKEIGSIPEAASIFPLARWACGSLVLGFS